MWTYRYFYEIPDDDTYGPAWRRAYIAEFRRQMAEYLLTGVPPDPQPKPPPKPLPLPEQLETRPPVPSIFTKTFDADELRPQPENA